MDSHNKTKPSEENASDEDNKSVVSSKSTPDYNWFENRMIRYDMGIYFDSETEKGTYFVTECDSNSEAWGEEINHGEEEVIENANDICDSEDEENVNTGPVLGKRKASDL
jgi:hypothetical protein